MFQVRCGCGRLRLVRERATGEHLLRSSCDRCGRGPEWLGVVPPGVLRVIRKDPSATAADQLSFLEFMAESAAEVRRPRDRAG